MWKRWVWIGVLAGRPLAAQTARTLDGVVRDSASGETLPGAVVTVPALALTARTNTDGRFVLVHVPAGRHTLRVHYIGYTAREVAIDVATVKLPLVSG